MRCRNKQCRAVLCTTDNENIYVGNLEITGKSIDLTCDKCGTATRWFKNSLNKIKN